MTNQEVNVVKMLGEVWNEFLKLDELHPSDKKEMQLAIHQAQNIVLARDGLRYINSLKNDKTGI